MRRPRPATRIAAFTGACALAITPGCYREITSEERLDRETRSVPLAEAAGAAELEKIDCSEAQGQLVKARNVNRPETERVRDYMSLYADLQEKTKTFETAMARNPDLQYQEGSKRFADAKEVCVQQQADVRVEFERYVRDLVELPTVQELKGGNTVTVARLDFDTLREAINALGPDDKELLLTRVETAEKKIKAKPEPRRGR